MKKCEKTQKSGRRLEANVKKFEKIKRKSKNVDVSI